MLKSRKIAITGNLASGKSTVCRFFRELGAYVVSSDEIVHQLLSPETNIGKKVIALLGDDIVVESLLNREALAKVVFHDRQLLLRLEELLHPEVQKEIDVLYQKNCQKYRLFVAEVPLLFEAGYQSFYDLTLIVTADKKFRKKRSAYGEPDFEQREVRMIPPEKKIEMADLVIENNGPIEELKTSVERVYKNLV